MIALFECGFQGERTDRETFVIRAQDGRWTDRYLAMRREMGTVVWNKPV